jgi:aspartyl aminopeptidase
MKENKKLYDKLKLDKKSAWLKLKEKSVFDFSEDYKTFLGKSKTERDAISNIITILNKNNFKDIEKVKNIKSGDKLYLNFREKAVLAVIVGENKSELRIIGSHVDSPRLDLKPNPLYEDSGLAMFKSHYYGGIKKYQWVNIPLEMRGTIFTKNGKKITLNEDYTFVIPDLLIHLATKQVEKKAKVVVEGEELNIVLGNIPIEDKDIKEQVKFHILKILNEKYGIIEEDFNCAEIQFVPKNNPMDIGFDKSLVGGYGQDDKVCAFTSLIALTKLKQVKNTAITMFVDKEEIGSMGNTGAASFILYNFVNLLKTKAGIKEDTSRLLEKAKSISADVTAGMNPNFKDANEPLNSSFLGKGVSIEKYGGAYGKFGTHDASAEYMSYLRKILDENKIPWQTGELGKIDLGGGGTIGMFLSRYGMNCVDVGPCVLGMHSPFEIASKADIYSAYLFYKAFFEKV